MSLFRHREGTPMQSFPKLRDGVQAVLALGLTLAVIYLTIVGKMDTDIIAALAGTAIAFYLAERKNGAEREHAERIEGIKTANRPSLDPTRPRRRG